MNKACVVALSFLFSHMAYAQQLVSGNIIRTPAPIAMKQSSGEVPAEGEWLTLSPIYSEWIAEPVICQSYLPDTSTILNNEPFTQAGVDCSRVERRTVTTNEQNTLTQELRLLSETEEQRTISATDSRSALGTQTVSYSKVLKTVKTHIVGSNTQTFTGALKASDVLGKTSFANGNFISALYLHQDTNPSGYYFKLTLSGVSTTLASDAAALTYLESVMGTMTVSSVNLTTATARVSTRSGGALAVYWILSAAQFNTLSQVNDAFTVTYAKN